METTKDLVAQYNEKLLNKLFPKDAEVIYCNAFIDPNDPFFNLSFNEIAKINLKEIELNGID